MSVNIKENLDEINFANSDNKSEQNVSSNEKIRDDISKVPGNGCKINDSEHIPPIELSLPQPAEKIFESVEKRYYKRYYKVQENKEDQVVLLHSNRICLITLSPKHPIIQNKQKILNLEFEVGNKRKPTDRLSNKVTGKGKKGGQSVDEKAILCVVHCEGGNK